MTYGKKTIEHNIIAVHPLPTMEELKSYYNTQYYQTADGNKTTYDTIYTEEELEHKNLESKISLHALENHVKKGSEKLSLVEFGCGEGFFLNQAASAGWDVQGVDFSKFGVEKWHPHLMEHFIVGDSYDYLKKCEANDKKFNVCVLRNVLEHMIDPVFFLNNLKKILKPDGIILITVPNDYSPIQKLAMELKHIDKEFWFAPPDHLYYFNTTNIRPFVEDNGFQVLDMYSSFPVDFFLFHPGSNYVKEKTKGKDAHFARIHLDLLIAKGGIEKAYKLYRSLAECGMGRDFTVLLKANA